MESKAGSILLLISGILTLLGSLIVLIIGIATPFMDVEGNAALGMVFIFGLFIILVVLGILKLWASKMMKDPARTSKGGIIALVVGIISGGDLLAIIGGILGIVQAKQ